MQDQVRKSLRLDLLIALFALLISTLTAAAAMYQGHLIANQLSVTVWPYLSYRMTTSNAYVELAVENVGVGPAIIRGAVLYIDGAKQPSLASAIRRLGYVKGTNDTVTLSSVTAGDVIRAGDAITIARVQSNSFAAKAATMRPRVRIETCYCSILSQCWMARTGEQSPASIPNCDAYSRTALSP